MGLSQDEIFEKVQEALVDALGVDDDEVNREATLVGDLGAESIDFLDIVFKLEKSFGINIERTELAPEDILTNGKVLDHIMQRNDRTFQLQAVSTLFDLIKDESAKNPM